MRKILLVEISGPSKAIVDRAGNLLQDQIRSCASFIQSSIEDFADDGGRTVDDPPVVTPTITVSDAQLHREGKA